MLNHDKYVTTPQFNKFSGEIFHEKLKQIILRTKADMLAISNTKSYGLSLKQDKEKDQLNVSQRQAVIKSIQKNIEIKGTLKIGDQYHYLTLIQKLYQNLWPQT